MPDVSFGNLLVVSAIAALAPLLLGFAPRLKVPAIVLEIVAGVVVGPSALGWVPPSWGGSRRTCPSRSWP